MAAALSRVYAGLCRRDRLTSKECPFWFYSLFCDWDEHKTLCTAIKNLYISTERGLGDSADENVFISHLTSSQRNTVPKLVGEKCHVRCELNGIETDVLWDTGTQVSIIPERILRENFPNLLVKDIRELLASGADLKLEAAIGTRIPYNEWIGIKL
jgi:hypothetical protein